MKLIDMAYTPAEIKEEKAEMTSKPKVPSYPWGLQLRLEKEELAKLGITKLPGVGDEYHIIGVGHVTDVAQSYRDSDEYACVTIQINMLELSNEGQEADDDTPAAEGKEFKSQSAPKSVLSYYGSKK